MNSETECKSCSRCAYVVAIIGAFLIVGGLVFIMRHYTRTEPLGANRAAERKKALVQLRAENLDVLHGANYAWQDQAKGVVRMPIDRAMELSLKWWQNPATARSNLVAREEKATFVPPPPAYE